MPVTESKDKLLWTAGSVLHTTASLKDVHERTCAGAKRDSRHRTVGDNKKMTCRRLSRAVPFMRQRHEVSMPAPDAAESARTRTCIDDNRQGQ